MLVAIILGVTFGLVSPTHATELKPLADAFIALVKMMIGPVIFCTIALGISEAGSMKELGRVGLKTMVYFEVVSTFALFIGLLVVNTLKPGAGFHIDPTSLDGLNVREYTGASDHSLHIIPQTLASAFTEGNLLQVLLVALLFGIAMNLIGPKAQRVHELLSSLSKVLFKMVGLIMYFAPIAAGSAMAFTVGKYGAGALRPLVNLMGCFYLSCILFIVVVLGLIARWSGFSIFRFLFYIRGELLTVLATSSSETVIVPLMEKLEKLGCPRRIVGVVVPAGYSFNLDGTNIYLTMAALFVAQSMGINLTLSQQLSILIVAMLTSKGASGVTGAGLITLAATLTVTPEIPVAGLALIIGVDRFMSEARALTNMVGNGVAALAIAKSESRELQFTDVQSKPRPARQPG